MSAASSVGYIYVVQMEGHNLYKIGRSVNVPRRMSQIGVQLPYPYRLIFAYRSDDVRRREEWLHCELKEFRRNGEWFELEDRHIQYIRSHLLICQSQRLTERIVQKMAGDDLYPFRLHQYVRVLGRIVTRNDRRIEINARNHYHCFQHDPIVRAAQELEAIANGEFEA